MVNVYSLRCELIGIFIELYSVDGGEVESEDVGLFSARDVYSLPAMLRITMKVLVLGLAPLPRLVVTTPCIARGKALFVGEHLHTSLHLEF